jgi:hypothetical protein
MEDLYLIQEVAVSKQPESWVLVEAYTRTYIRGTIAESAEWTLYFWSWKSFHIYLSVIFCPWQTVASTANGSQTLHGDQTEHLLWRRWNPNQQPGSLSQFHQRSHHSNHPTTPTVKTNRPYKLSRVRLHLFFLQYFFLILWSLPSGKHHVPLLRFPRHPTPAPTYTSTSSYTYTSVHVPLSAAHSHWRG